MLLVAGIASVSLYASRRQLLAAAGVALVGGLVVIDALGASGVDLVRVPPHSLYSVRASPLLIVPTVGVGLALGALIMSRSGPRGIYGDGRGDTKSRR
jgi:ABC-type tungstate transport system substrate-binding protein